MRVFTATLGTETDSFSPLPTGWAGFEKTMLFRPGQHPDFATEATGPLWACRQRARTQGWDVVEGTCAFAMPGGLVNKTVYEALRDEILVQLRQAMPVDMVALGLHGAMMAQGYPDCEGDMLARVRQMVGPQVPVGAELDCHAHLTDAMLQAADVIVLFKEYPHTDYVARAEELLELLALTANGRIKPVMQAFDCRMIASFVTDRPPMREYVDRMRRLEGKNGVLSVSLVHGFALGDMPDMGSKMLVITDDDAATAEQLARTLGHELYALRDHFAAPAALTLNDALDEALSLSQQPVILVDRGDNPGGGAPGDNTDVLHELVRRGIKDVCAGPLWDPQAVEFCFSAGQGAMLPLRVGGKACRDSGRPMDVLARIIGLKRNLKQKLGDALVPLGDAAAIQFSGIHLVLTTLRDQAYDPVLFTDLGVEPTEHRFILLKSGVQYKIGFDELSVATVRLPTGVRLTDRSYRCINRPRWPFDSDCLLKDI
jgi:microcystin degradation protein MlrC